MVTNGRVAENSSGTALEKLLSQFAGMPKLERARIMQSKAERANVDRFYKFCLESIASIPYSLEDISELCKHVDIKDEQRDEFGLYVSALINNVIKEGDRLEINLSSKRLHFLGSFLARGNLSINGDLGNFAFYNMTGGNVGAKGNVGDFACMGQKGGSVAIYGYSGEKTGTELENGEIFIAKDTGLNLCENSLGGVVHVGGRYADIGERCKALIYIAGRRRPTPMERFLSTRLFSEKTRRYCSRSSLATIIPTIVLQAISYMDNNPDPALNAVSKGLFTAFSGFIAYGLTGRVYVTALPNYRQRSIDIRYNHASYRRGISRLKAHAKNVLKTILDVADYLS